MSAHGPLVKICGLTRPQDAFCAIEQGADILGVVMSDLSPRKGSKDLVKSISTMGGEVACVYTDLDTALKDSTVEDYVQLHFKHDREEISIVKRDLGKKIISVVFPSDSGNCYSEATRKLSYGADLVLIDFGKNILTSGLNGLTDLAGTRIGIAGKISEDSVRQALKYNPYFLDLSSSLEDSPGIKNREKISGFMGVLRIETSAQ